MSSTIHEIGADTRAIAASNGPGPFKIVNNYLEAAGEDAGEGVRKGDDTNEVVPGSVPSAGQA